MAGKSPLGEGRGIKLLSLGQPDYLPALKSCLARSSDRYMSALQTRESSKWPFLVLGPESVTAVCDSVAPPPRKPAAGPGCLVMLTCAVFLGLCRPGTLPSRRSEFFLV